jgi:hypothetical protein
MASSYSSDLKLELMVTGEKSGLWGDITNTNLTILQQAIAGYEAISIAGGVQTTALTFSNGLVSNGKNAVIKLTGTITGNQTVTIPDSIEKTYIIENGTTGAFTVEFKSVSGTGPTWSTTDKGIKILFSDGTNVVDVNADLSAVTIGGNLSVDGGTIKLDGNYPVGTNNVALGDGALDDGSLTGGCNVAIGANALTANTTGTQNTAVGTSALRCNVTGTQNVAVGYLALCTNTASTNTAVGNEALRNNTTGSSNEGIGRCALNANTTGTANSAIGTQALSTNTTGSNNTALGYLSLTNNIGDNNTMIGHTTGCNLTTGCYNTFVGYGNQPSAAGVLFEYVYGYTATGKGAGTFFVNGTNGSYNGGNTTTWTQVSDRRIKKNITDNNDGLEKIKNIRIRNFEYRTENEITDFENPKSAFVDKQGVQLGVIAQEIEEILPDVIIEQSNGVKSVNTDNIIWYLINAIKELTAEIDLLKNK